MMRMLSAFAAGAVISAVLFFLFGPALPSAKYRFYSRADFISALKKRRAEQEKPVLVNRAIFPFVQKWNLRYPDRRLPLMPDDPYWRTFKETNGPEIQSIAQEATAALVDAETPYLSDIDLFCAVAPLTGGTSENLMTQANELQVAALRKLETLVEGYQAKNLNSRGEGAH